MKTEEFIRRQASEFQTQYQKFMEAVKNDEDENYFKYLQNMTNLVEYLIRFQIDVSKDAKFYDVISELKFYGAPKNIINNLHYFRQIRNNIIHDISNKQVLDYITRRFTAHILESFISWFAKEFYETDIVLTTNNFIIESDDKDKNESVDIANYKKITKQHIPTHVSDSFKPTITTSEILEEEIIIIFKHIFGKQSIENLINEYEMSKKAFTNLLEKYGFTYDFKEVLSDYVLDTSVVPCFVEDFFDKSSTKANLILDMVKIYDSTIKREGESNG